MNDPRTNTGGWRSNALRPAFGVERLERCGYEAVTVIRVDAAGRARRFHQPREIGGGFRLEPGAAIRDDDR